MFGASNPLPRQNRNNTVAPSLGGRACLASLGRRFFAVGIGLFFASLVVLPAAQPYTPKISDPLLDPWRWQKFTELDGKNPYCMVEGKDGAMWFGVSDG